MTGPDRRVLFAPVVADLPDPAGTIMARHVRWVAEQVAAAGEDAARRATVTAVIATLSQTAAWVCDDDATTLANAAAAVLTWSSTTPRAGACPLCEERVCEPGCALAGFRATLPTVSAGP